MRAEAVATVTKKRGRRARIGCTGKKKGDERDEALTIQTRALGVIR